MYTGWLQLHFHEFYAIVQQIITYAYLFKGHEPKDQNKQLALGHKLKMIHLGVNKMISSKTAIESYFTSVETQNEPHDYHKTSNLSEMHKETLELPKPATVKLNDYNINGKYEAMLQAHIKHNQDAENPLLLCA